MNVVPLPQPPKFEDPQLTPDPSIGSTPQTEEKENFWETHSRKLEIGAVGVLLILASGFFIYSILLKQSSVKTEVAVLNEQSISSSAINPGFDPDSISALAQMMAEENSVSVVEEIIPSPSPTPTIVPTPINQTSKITTPTPTPAPVPKSDLKTTWDNFPRPAGPGEGCFAGQDPSNPVYCEVKNTETSLVSYFMEIENSGNDDVNNLLIRLVLDGKSSDHYIQSILHGEKKTITIPLTGEVGNHTGTVSINPDKTFLETNYDNNNKSFTLEIKPDSIAPSATLDVFNKSATSKCFSPFVMDNVDSEYQLTLELQIDSGSWKTIPSRPDPGSEQRYEECLYGVSGDSHQGRLKVTDRRGNTSESSATMNF